MKENKMETISMTLKVFNLDKITEEKLMGFLTCENIEFDLINTF